MQLNLSDKTLHYLVAGFLIAASTLAFFVSKYVLGVPCLVSFIGSVALSSCLGWGPGLLALVLATLVSDFFFIPPLMQLNLDRLTWLAMATYAAALLLTRGAVQLAGRKMAGSLLFGKPVAGQNGRALMGRLDGDMAGVLCGWAVDRDLPSIPPKITLFADKRVVGEVLPVWYRPDVGQHSFFFDLSLVCPAGSRAIVEATFADGCRLSNCPLSVRVPSQLQRRHSETVLFMHIPRAAGAAFCQATIDNYRHSEVAYLYSHVPGFLIPDLGALPLQQRANFRFVIGHFRYGVHSLLPQECTYVTVVRDPVRRVVSHFQFLLETEIAVPAGAKLPDFLVMLLESHATVNLDNLMVRFFSGIADTEMSPGSINRDTYDRAVHNLRVAFKFIGHQERSNEAYTALCERFGWNVRRPLEVVNRGQPADNELFESVRPAIEHFNRWDCLLYEEIQRLASR